MICYRLWSILFISLSSVLSHNLCTGFLPCNPQFLPEPIISHRHQDIIRHRRRLFQTTSVHVSDQPTVAVLGGDLAGIAAALSITQEKQDCSVCLFTGHSHILKGIFNTETTPILPDVTLENREIIERYGNGGRELAGILAKECSPLQAKEWLEDQGIILQEEGSTDDISILLQEKPLFVSPKCNLIEVFERNLVQANVCIKTNVFVKDIKPQEGGGFRIDLGKNTIVNVDVLIIANDYSDRIQDPILVLSKNDEIRKPAKNGFACFDFDDDNGPLSLKEQMALKTQQQKYAKKQRIDELVKVNDVNLFALSKQDQRTLAKKRKRETKRQKEQLKQTKKGTSGGLLDEMPLSASINESMEEPIAGETTNSENDNDNDEATTIPTESQSRALNTIELAATLGHTIINASPGMFDFLVPTKGILEGCSKAIVPKARLRCKVDLPQDKKYPKATRLPKMEGPLLMAQGEVSGSGALRLSTRIAHAMAKSKHRGTLQIHFAPDIGGVEDIVEMISETADPNESVLKSPCPLVHREIDYNDYDFESGDFKSVVFPLVSDRLWHNLCQQAGITVAKLKWKDLPPNKLKSLARVFVDCSIQITGIRPNDNIMAGGVSLKELDFSEGCKSRIQEELFVCGSAIDVHGFDRGFNPLASLATGRVAGLNAIHCLSNIR